jgi:hypothetical protein
MGLDIPTREEEYDEDNPGLVEPAEYIGLKHAWVCPSCGEIGYEDELDDPRAIGYVVICDCGWSGRVQ